VRERNWIPGEIQGRLLILWRDFGFEGLMDDLRGLDSRVRRRYVFDAEDLYLSKFDSIILLRK
jgi:hypothetical protein